MQSQPPPMLGPEAYQGMRDAEHLKLLAIFHYVLAGLQVLGACFFSLYVVAGVAMTRIPVSTGTGGGAGGTGGPGTGVSPADAKMFEMMAMVWTAIGGVGALVMLAVAVGAFFAGRFISARRHPTFVLVVAGIECLFFPLGTALGVFTIIVMVRPSVKDLFVSDGDRIEAGQSNA